jgi:hypothetical protein
MIEEIRKSWEGLESRRGRVLKAWCIIKHPVSLRGEIKFVWVGLRQAMIGR